MARHIAAALLILLPLVVSGGRAPASAAPDPADFQPVITNQFFPLSSLAFKVFRGSETDEEGARIETRLESRLLSRTEIVAGVSVAVLEEKAFEDGELVELALDYFAQHRDGSVYYFGELVDNYEDGRLKDHAGQWQAGKDGAEAGIIMPAQPQVGATFRQELAPGIAEDMATIVALGETVSVPAGTFTGCLKTRDFTPLEPGVEEFKWYCPGVGLVKEQGARSVLELVSVVRQAVPAATANAPSTPAPPTPAALPPREGLTPPSTGSGGLLPAAGRRD
jgi:hypothetical protein